MLDKVVLRLKAGDGGRGAVTFRREKFVPFGGPFGGDGGKGGDVIVTADASVSTLRAFQRRRSYKAEDGGHGMTKNKHGKDGLCLQIHVPPGTLVYERPEEGDDQLLADLEKEGQQVTVAKGGRGGWGNLHFATATNQAPRIAQPGSVGPEKMIVLEMRLIADAGIVGFPNAGKSSLLGALSAANPKIADYPFTTLEPIQGVVYVDKNSFVLAEIPGLIEGAHAGKGLGDEFLRHAMRTKLLIHLVDGSAPAPLDNMIMVNNELALWDTELAKRPQMVAINKIDLPEVKERIPEIRASFDEAGIRPVFISAATGEGLEDFKVQVWTMLQESEKQVEPIPEQVLTPRVFHPQAVDSAAKVHKKGSAFILVDPAVEKLLDRLDLENPASLKEFNQKLEQLGINRMLKSAGAKPGDTVITGATEWEWYEG